MSLRRELETLLESVTLEARIPEGETIVGLRETLRPDAVNLWSTLKAREEETRAGTTVATHVDAQGKGAIALTDRDADKTPPLRLCCPVKDKDGLPCGRSGWSTTGATFTAHLVEHGVKNNREQEALRREAWDEQARWLETIQPGGTYAGDVDAARKARTKEHTKIVADAKERKREREGEGADTAAEHAKKRPTKRRRKTETSEEKQSGTKRKAKVCVQRTEHRQLAADV